MSQQWINDNDREMDLAERWSSEAEDRGIQEEWWDAYDGDEEPQVKNITVWISVEIDTSQTYQEAEELLQKKLDKLDWEFE